MSPENSPPYQIPKKTVRSAISATAGLFVRCLHS